MSRGKKSSVTIRDVARKANVSVATVSRYINGTARVSDEVAKRLDRVMEELNYVPHSTARRLATKKTNTIGLLLTDMSGDFFAPLLRGIESMAREKGYDLLISSAREAYSQVRNLPLGPHNCDGILVFTTSLDDGCLQALSEMSFPVVLIHRSTPPELNIPCVTVENKAASYKLVSHLIEEHERQRIVFLRGPKGHEDSYWREMGYKQALLDHGIPLDESLISFGEFFRRKAYQSMWELLSGGVQFDGVFAGDDEAAVGVLVALREAGVRVPEEVSVVGFDDQRMSPYLQPPLTTVRAPTEDVGKEAVRQLVKLIQIGEADPLTLLPTEIVLRRSCGCEFGSGSPLYETW